MMDSNLVREPEPPTYLRREIQPRVEAKIRDGDLPFHITGWENWTLREKAPRGCYARRGWFPCLVVHYTQRKD